jgi:hypothetical protein
MVWTEERRKSHSKALKRAWKAKRKKANRNKEANGGSLDVESLLKKLAKTSEFVRQMGSVEAATAGIEAYQRLGCDMRATHALFRRMRVVDSSAVKEDTHAGSNGA